MKIELQEPFRSKWKFGYLRESKLDGRKRVDLFNSNDDRTTISYARYLLSVDMGSEIPDGYEVDHIDEDNTNDDISNLQILTEEEHRKKNSLKQSTGRATVTLICPECGTLFERAKNRITVAEPKCSKQCSGRSSMRKKNVS